MKKPVSKRTSKQVAAIAGRILNSIGDAIRDHQIVPTDYVFVRTKVGKKFTIYLELACTVAELESLAGSTLAQAEKEMKTP